MVNVVKRAARFGKYCKREARNGTLKKGQQGLVNVERAARFGKC